MKFRNLLLFVGSISLFACQSNKNETSGAICNTTVDKSEIIRVAMDLVNNNDGEIIWSLTEIDTLGIVIYEDHFVSAECKNTLAIIDGYTMSMSSGNADKLLLLFSCDEMPKVLWFEQGPEVSPDDIVDLNGNGLKEIILKSQSLWMGNCNDAYEIISLSKGEKKTVYKANSYSRIDCGGLIEMLELNIGDTLSNMNEFQLENEENGYNLRVDNTIKIYNGGNTEDEIYDKLIKVSSTNVVVF